MPDTMIQSPVASSAMPAEIARAIGEVMMQIKSLPKNERNDHGGYAFASIDDFLSAIGPLLAQAGLIAIQDEHQIDTLERGGKTWLKATYSFTLAHISGVLWDRPLKRTVFQQITGPQTTGSCQSYCLKQFLRSLFAVPCGDRDDADYHKPQEMPAAQQTPQRPAQRVEQRQRADVPKAAQAIQRPPGDSGEPAHIYIEEGPSGLLIGSWVKRAKEALEGQSESTRRAWLEDHAVELDEVRRLRPDWCDKIESLAIAPDPVAEVAA